MNKLKQRKIDRFVHLVIMKLVFLSMDYFDLDVKVNVRVFYFVKKRKKKKEKKS